MTEPSDNLHIRLQTELDQVKDEYQKFVYAVTHDLAAPFRQIEGFVNIIQTENTDSFDDATKRHFDFVLKGVDKGQIILDALSGYSRLVNADHVSSDVDCNSIVEEVKKELSSIIQKMNATIIYEELPQINGDRAQLYQLFYHLIHNALHYQTADSTPHISIVATEKENLWLFSIKDNGIGFKNKLTDKLFIALRRGVSEKIYSGNGMGLAIAKSIVHRHGGSISAKSIEREGSEFSFTLEKGDVLTEPNSP